MKRRDFNRAAIDEALARAKGAIPHGHYSVLRAALHSQFAKSERLELPDPPKSDTDLPVPYYGAEAPRVLFVAGQPSRIDGIRFEPLTGAPGLAFRETYCKALHVDRNDVGIVHAFPCVREAEPTEAELRAWGGWLRTTIEKADPECVIALGQLAARGLALAGLSADETVPHPGALLTTPARAEQVTRKLTRIRKALDAPLDTESDSSSEVNHPSDSKPGVDREIQFAKSDKAKQIVYAVVLDPYSVDSDGHWVPPAHVEAAAHSWFSKAAMRWKHGAKAALQPVESWVVPYPSEDEYRKAIAGEAHRAHRMPFGKDTIHSGAWLLGAKLGDQEWAAHLRGEVDAFSLAGKGWTTPVRASVMPEVKFVDLAEVR
jgi:uracil-DNA glycosylase